MLVHQFLHQRALCQTGLVHALQQPTIQQKPPLARVAQHLQPGVLSGQRNAGEVNVRGDVFAAHLGQRVTICQMVLVAHHCAHVALRVVILVFGKAVIQQKNRTGL